MTAGNSNDAQRPVEAGRVRLIRLIHVARRELRLDDDVYRAMLRAETGADSSAKLSVPQLERVLARMKRAGFKVNVKVGRKLDRAPQSRKIRALWLDLHARGVVRDPSEKALAAWVKRESGTEDLAWIDSAQAARLIERLKLWGKRTGGGA